MKEADIRPQAIFDEYLRLCALDTETYFGSAERHAIACPACGAQGNEAFTKNGFTYEHCTRCESLYVSPRPVAQAFSDYYTTAPSSKFWATTFYRETADARRRLLWQPKARNVAAKLAANAAQEYAVIDIGGGYGLFAEEIRALTKGPVIVIEPAPHLAEVCRQKGLTVVEKFLETVQESDLPKGGRAFVSFELFEHLFDPRAFLTQLRGLMAPGDLFMFTTLSGTGLDIRLLWSQSKSISPPHHLNFLNPASVSGLLRDVGFDVLEVTTPGALDIDILANNKASVTDPFWKLFLDRADEAQKQEWQKLISASGWSSHMMAVCRKP
jgi:hypothetical protein